MSSDEPKEAFNTDSPGSVQMIFPFAPLLPQTKYEHRKFSLDCLPGSGNVLYFK